MKKSAASRDDRASKGDSRFAVIHSDPRFRRFPKTAKRVEVDERFSGMFSDPRFHAPSTVDKRGRKVKKQSKGENMRKFYHLKDEDDWGQDAAARGQPAATSLEGQKASITAADNPDTAGGAAAELEDDSAPAELASSSSEDEDEDQKAKERWARLRGLAGPQSSSSESDDDGGDEPAGSAEESEDPDQALTAEFGVGAMAANPDEHIPAGQESPRLAIVDLDWDRVRAVDILVVLSSFLKRPQAIRAVTIYPSDFGQQRMKEEASMGPRLGPAHPRHRQTQLDAVGPSANDRAAAQEVAEHSSEDDEFASDASSGDDHMNEQSSDDEAALLKEAHASSDASGSSEDDDGLGGQDAAASSDAEASVSSGDEAVQRRLAVYERSRLRYFYAVVECDSPATGAHLYRECDGLEFERSANKLDLRFVPADQSFAERPVHDRATSIPPGYLAPDFATKALQHTRVQLTWDADDETRKKALQGRKVNAEQLRDDDFKAYMGSSDEEQGEAARKGTTAPQADAAKLKLLLQQASNPARRAGGKTWGAADDSEEELGEETNGMADRRKSHQAAGARDVDMQVTFTGGLEGLSERLAARKKDKNATVWDKYLQHQREKRRQAKQTGRRRGGDSDADDSADEHGQAEAADPFFAPEADPFKDPFFQDDQVGAEVAQAPRLSDKAGQTSRQASKADAVAAQPADDKAVRKQAAKAERMRKAQLELLMMDDSALQDATKLGGVEVAESDVSLKKQKASRKQRIRDKKEARRQDRAAGSDDEDAQQRTGSTFQVDVEDPRFKSLFTSHHFALDPTDPRFTSSTTTANINAEIKRRQSAHASGTRAKGAASYRHSQPTEPAGRQQGDALNVMIAGLKRKAAAMHQTQKPAKTARSSRLAKTMTNT